MAGYFEAGIGIDRSHGSAARRTAMDGEGEHTPSGQRSNAPRANVARMGSALARGSAGGWSRGGVPVPVTTRGGSAWPPSIVLSITHQHHAGGIKIAGGSASETAPELRSQNRDFWIAKSC